MKKRIPASFQPLFWSQNVASLDFERDKIYIIHHTLRYGTLKHIKWLFQIYPPAEIRRVFAKYPMKLYSKPSFHFTKKFILKIRNHLDEKKYFSFTRRIPAGSRA